VWGTKRGNRRLRICRVRLDDTNKVEL